MKKLRWHKKNSIWHFLRNQIWPHWTHTLSWHLLYRVELWPNSGQGLGLRVCHSTLDTEDKCQPLLCSSCCFPLLEESASIHVCVKRGRREVILGGWDRDREECILCWDRDRGEREGGREEGEGEYFSDKVQNSSIIFISSSPLPSFSFLPCLSMHLDFNPWYNCFCTVCFYQKWLCQIPFCVLFHGLAAPAWRDGF